MNTPEELQSRPRRKGIVIAGGSGERFWPLSTPQRPKQLLKLTHPSETMLEESFNRISPLFGREGVFIATTTTLIKPVTEANIALIENVFAEPAKRNTLGAFCWFTAQLIARGEQDATLAIVTADHMIGDAAAFQGTLIHAMEIAETRGGFVTIGITPTRPETGFGYIEVDHSQPTSDRAWKSSRFREKPDLATAEQFLSAGNFLWNSGMFVFTIASLLSELGELLPDVRTVIDQISQALKANDQIAATEAFEKLPNVSIDYAVMEKARDVYVVQADFTWDDVGSWDALGRTFAQDADGNVTQGNVVALHSNNCILVNESSRQVVGALGLQDIVVAVTDDAILVCSASEAQNVRKVGQACAEAVR